MPELWSPGTRVAELRHLFDSAFSEAPAAAAPELDDLLAIRAGDNPYALRLAEIAGVVGGTTVTGVPDQSPALLGLASVRGTIVSVYDLGVLLGHDGGGTAHWLVLTATDATLGLAFDQFEGHLRVPRDAVAVTDEATRRPTQAQEVVRVGDAVRPIVAIAPIVEEITRRVRQETEHRER